MCWRSGIAEVSFWGPEAEFFVFSHLSYTTDPQHMSYQIDSPEAAWKIGENNGTPNLGYKIPTKGGYFPVPPFDTLQDMRSEIVGHLESWGARVEMHHHEVATAGQCEIDMRFDSLRNMADKLLMYKYIVKNIARQHNMVATFMQKPLFADNGSGMHCHQSLWKDGVPLFYDAKGYALISQLCKWYIGGLIKHGRGP